MDALQGYDRAAAEYLSAKKNLAGAIIDARRAGVSWTDIGRPLGITKQAAQQKFGGMVALASGEWLATGPVPTDGGHRKPRVDAYDMKMPAHDGSPTGA